jgi:NAD(P)-dependent dehydrogenase (short-subunit alcohol dehydrogenase family)
MLQSDVPVGRLGTPHEVAGLVAYLVSDRAGFATGQIWTLDGGQVRR